MTSSIELFRKLGYLLELSPCNPWNYHVMIAASARWRRMCAPPWKQANALCFRGGCPHQYDRKLACRARSRLLSWSQPIVCILVARHRAPQTPTRVPIKHETRSDWTAYLIKKRGFHQSCMLSCVTDWTVNIIKFLATTRGRGSVTQANLIDEILVSFYISCFKTLVGRVL